MRALRETLDKRPIRFEYNASKLLDTVNSETKVISYAQEDDNIFYNLAHYCELNFATSNMPQKVGQRSGGPIKSCTTNRLQTTHYIFRKGSQLKELFDRAIRHESVSIRRIIQFYKKINLDRRARYCSEYLQRNQRAKPLSVFSFLGLFIILMVGLFFACVIFLMETQLKVTWKLFSDVFRQSKIANK